jgi:cystathionine gamma-lyase
MKIGTKLIHAGKDVKQGEAFAPPVVFAGPFFAEGDPADIPFVYTRYDNPTFARFEEAVAELEGGRTVVFSSGMAAVTAVFGAVLRPGDVLLIQNDCYFGVRKVAGNYLSEMGVDVRLFDAAEDGLAQKLPGAKLLWLESPSNPNLFVSDLRAMTRLAREHGVLSAIDNSTATPLGQRPLELGADISVASDTKALTGHSDLILGHVSLRDDILAEKILAWRMQTGAVPGPMEVWLAHRSLATLEMRLERQCANAMKIAEFLKTRAEISGVRYPGLPDDPAHLMTAKQMDHFGPIIGFVLKDKDAADKFLTSCKLIASATSFGGMHTTAERRARWGGDNIPEGFIRLSVGCENAEDIIEDNTQALD